MFGKADIKPNMTIMIMMMMMMMMMRMMMMMMIMALWCSGYRYCTTSFNKVWTQVLRRFNTWLQPVRDSRWWDVWQWSWLEISLKCLLLVNPTTKTIHLLYGFVKESKFVEYTSFMNGNSLQWYISLLSAQCHVTPYYLLDFLF